MNPVIKIGIAILLISSCTEKIATVESDRTKDLELINETISSWDSAWETKNVEQAIQYYADSTDWTNAFGDRVQSKEELRKLLEFIFSLDFVMTGKNNYGENDIKFLNDSIATVRSKNVRTNQTWPDGSAMGDRHINHLRVYKKIDGQWLVINHMISQAWPKHSPATEPEE